MTLKDRPRTVDRLQVPARHPALSQSTLFDRGTNRLAPIVVTDYARRADVSSVTYLNVTGLELSDAGSLHSHPDPAALAAAEEACRKRCYDWYSNARPFFAGERIFALMGPEIVEGTLVKDRVVEKRRVSLVPRL
jgi:hypothetical protein